MLLQIKNLVKTYGNERGVTINNLEIDSGHVVGLLGPNGCGKTTLIKLINGLLTPNEGEILVEGNKIGIESKSIISYLPERTYLDNDMKVMDCLSYFMDFYKDFDKDKALRMLDELKVPLDARLKTLSKGTKEKVQLILVMSRNAKLYILDEPIAGVDPVAREIVLKMVIDNMANGSTLLICTHLIRDVEPILDDVVFLNEGKLIAHKSVNKIEEENGSVSEFFKEAYFQCL